MEHVAEHFCFLKLFVMNVVSAGIMTTEKCVGIIAVSNAYCHIAGTSLLLQKVSHLNMVMLD